MSALKLFAGLAIYAAVATLITLELRYVAHRAERARLELMTVAPATTWGVITADGCGDHGRVSYRYRFQGVDYTGRDGGPECDRSLDRGVPVWLSARAPEVSLLRDPATVLEDLAWSEMLGAVFGPFALIWGLVGFYRIYVPRRAADALARDRP
jgi:hypothetical protein